MLTGSDQRIFGGHQIQLAETSAALLKLGIDVQFTSEVTFDDLRGIDVVHAWWPSLSQARKVRTAGVPLVATTVYIPILNINSDQWIHIRRIRMAAALARQALAGRHVEGAERLLAQRTALRLLFETADLLLPNSAGEAALIRDELGVSTPMQVVPNGFNPSVFNEAGGTAWTARTGIIMAGRIEPHKNQLLLLRALRHDNIPVTIVGSRHPDHPSYYAACIREASRAVYAKILEPTSPVGLAGLMRSSRVHVLPSRWETTGLVSLEAAASGCNVVVSDRGHVRDYLGEDAWYCNELSPKALRAAILQAYMAGQNRSLIDRVNRSFTWEQAALATLRGYERVLREWANRPAIRHIEQPGAAS